MILVALLVAATIMLPSVQPVDLLAGFGVGSIAVGFAFKDILHNWMAGLRILLRQPFRIEDQIVVGEFGGTVNRIETRSTNAFQFGRERARPNMGRRGDPQGWIRGAASGG